MVPVTPLHRDLRALAGRTGPSSQRSAFSLDVDTSREHRIKGSPAWKHAPIGRQPRHHGPSKTRPAPSGDLGYSADAAGKIYAGSGNRIHAARIPGGREEPVRMAGGCIRASGHRRTASRRARNAEPGSEGPGSFCRRRFFHCRRQPERCRTPAKVNQTREPL